MYFNCISLWATCLVQLSHPVKKSNPKRMIFSFTLQTFIVSQCRSVAILNENSQLYFYLLVIQLSVMIPICAVSYC